MRRTQPSATAFDACVAGTVVAAIDVTVVLARSLLEPSDVAITSVLVIGLDLLAALVGVSFVYFFAIATAKLRPVRFVLDELATQGARRVRAIAWILASLVLVALFWITGFAMTVRAFSRFHSTTGAAIVAISASTLLLGGYAFAFAVITPRLARALSEISVLHRMTRSWPAAAVAFAAVVSFCSVLIWLLGRRLPAVDTVPVYQTMLALAVIAAVGIIAPGRRLLFRGRAFILAAASGLIMATMLMLPSEPTARDAIYRAGFASRTVLAKLLDVGDRDGDGVPGWFGGADCDDSNASVSPLRADIPDNTVDENCTGADAHRTTQVHRVSKATSDRAPGTTNVLLISVDALRADHLGVYGYGRSTSPHIDTLAAASIVFRRAHSPSPMTRRAMPALLFGRYASTLPLTEMGKDVVMRPNRLPTLGTALAAAGYRNHAIMAVSGILDDNWLEGFQSSQVIAEENELPNNALDVTDAALKWLGTPTTQPRFTWIHYTDPHQHYNRPPGSPNFGSRDVDRYDSEIVHVDAQIGRLLEALRTTGAMENTLVILTADHGEAFGERGFRFHAASLHEHQLRVPLIVYAPRRAPRVINNPVSLIDITPTVLDMVGLGRAYGMNGRSLRTSVEQGIEPSTPILSELIKDARVGRDMIAITLGREKLIWNIDTNSYERYLLDDDPEERTNVFDEASAAPLVRALHDAMDRELSVLPTEP